MSKWQIGDKIADHYEIHKVLTGGMGMVYVCYDNRDKTPVVLKTFQNKYFFSNEAVKFFKKEAYIWTVLEQFPYIVRVYRVEKLEEKLFIALEYIPPDRQGRNTLTHYLDSLTLPDILKFSIQFCYGMEYAYSRGIDAHRDIKPDNIMITPDKTVKITDFGLAKAFQEIQLKENIISTEQNPSLSIFQSKGKQICGTLPYMAPEQFDGYADKRSDIYSFGITLYQMITGGKLPFMGKTIQEWERLHRGEKVSVPRSPLSLLVEKCLEKKPEKRYSDFIQIRKELQEILFREIGEKIHQPEKQELDAWDHMNRGVSLYNLEKYEEAVDCFDKTLRLHPGYAKAWYNKGNALGNRPQEAVICYNKALELDPKNAEAWYNKGNALVQLGDYNEAVISYDKAINLDPRDADFWINKGNALVRLDRSREEVKACVDEAIKLTPRCAGTYHNIGFVLACLGSYEEAMKYVEKAIQISDDPSVSNKLKQLIFEKLRN